MRSRNTLLLLVLLVLVGFAAYYFSKKADTNSTLNTEETAFAVADTASVDKIFISYKNGQNHVLERTNAGHWTLDKKLEARQDKINLLLETLKRMEVKRPGDKASRNLAIRDFAALGRKVEIYQKGQLTKTFYVGQTTDNDLGTYFIMAGSENPYVLHIPGFNGFINSRFDITEMDWRSVPVFRNRLENINSLEMAYNGHPEESFKIEKNGNKFTVNGNPNTDQENVKAYLQNYSFINGEYFLPNPQNHVSDSLALQKPVATITITDAQPANSRKIILYPKDGDHLVALNPDSKEIMSVQTFVFGRLLVRKNGLLKK